MLALFSLVPIFLGDAYVICGKDPKQECLVWVDQCLRENKANGVEPDLSFEWCAEEVDPALVNFETNFPWPK